MPRIIDSRPLSVRLLWELEASCRSRRGDALAIAYRERRAALAAWDRAVASWRTGEGYDAAYDHLRATTTLEPPILVAIGH